MLENTWTHFYFIFSIELRKHVVFGSEGEDVEGTDYDANIVPEADVKDDKEDEFKKVLL